MKHLVWIVLILSGTLTSAQETFQKPIDNDTVFNNCCGFGPGQYCMTKIGACTSGAEHHSGKDYTADKNGTIYASASGRVIQVRWESAPNRNHKMGITIAIEHLLTNGSKITTLYAHLSAVYVSFGDIVSKGQAIGYQGYTGTTSDNIHLHFETKQWHDHMKDGYWGARSNDDYWRAMGNPKGTAKHFGYAPLDIDQVVDLGYIDPDDVIENPSYRAIQPLRLITDMSATQLPYQSPATVTTIIQATYTGTWEGRIYLELRTMGGDWLGDIQSHDVTWTGESENHPLTFQKDQILSPPGQYQLQITYTNGHGEKTEDLRQPLTTILGSNPAIVEVVDPQGCSMEIHDDFADCANDQWNFSRGNWRTCENTTQYGSLIQDDDSFSLWPWRRASARWKEKIDASSYQSYDVMAFFKVLSGSGSNSIAFDVIDGQVRLYMDDNKIVINNSGRRKTIQQVLNYDQDYTIRIYATPTTIQLYMGAVLLGEKEHANDWDEDYFYIKTYGNIALAVHDYRVSFVCKTNRQNKSHEQKIVETKIETKTTDTSSQVNSVKSVVVYPNPSTGTVYMTFPMAEQTSIVIYDMSGNKILSQNLKRQDQTSLSLNHMGTYVYHVIQQGILIGEGKIMITH